MLRDGQLVLRDVAVKLVHDSRNGSAALLQGGNLCLQGGNLCGKFATQLDNLVNLGIRGLQLIEGLQFLLHGHVGIGETLLQGYEGFPVVNRSLHFLGGGGFFGCCHKNINRFIFSYTTK